METIARVPYDPELGAGLAMFLDGLRAEQLTTEAIGDTRLRLGAESVSVDEVIGGRAVEYEDRLIPGPVGAPDVRALILRPRGGTFGAGAICYMHGGGMTLGDRFNEVGTLVEWVLEFGLVVVSVEYRLAPEHPHPAPVEDCYAGLEWMAENASGLGFDPARLLVMGASAGGGLCAAIALMARDRGGPTLAGQALICPMIDDRNDTVSAQQYDGFGAWDRGNNLTGWDALLGTARGGANVSPYAAPARAHDLSGLPPALIEVGAAEVFRDENVDYASRLWAAGGQAELNVWAGAFHGFTTVCPYAPVSKAAMSARRDWIIRTLGL